MSPQLRQIFISIIAALSAIWLGFQLAEGNYLWPVLASAVALGACLTFLLRLSFDVILTGMVLFGYLVGNRGFAQLTPSPGLPLFPAEAVLLIAGTWRCILWAFARKVPFVRDGLNHVLLAWLALGLARFSLDLPRYGFLAARDFAVVYYAGFFFLVQHMAREARARRWLLGCLLAGLGFLPFSFAVFSLFPEFVGTTLTVNGVPVILFKDDLALTYLGIASLMWFLVIKGPTRIWAMALSLGLVLWIMASENRASQLGLLGAAALLFFAGRRRFPLTLGAVGALTALLLVGLAIMGNNAWAQGKLRSTADRIISITDFSGEGSYRQTEGYYKSDNNRFRVVWWKNVVMETWQTNPVLGLGFGHDLAGGFLQEYYPEGTSEDFSARSPHNIFVTVFGRMGLAGLAVWLSFCWLLLARTWRMLKRSESGRDWAFWCSPWVLIISASFGVVLEGPMGAMPFWVLLGLANASVLDGANSAGPEQEPPA